MIKQKWAGLTALALALVGGPAEAAFTWNFSGDNAGCPALTCWGNTRSFTAAGTGVDSGKTFNVTVSAWSFTGDTPTTNSALQSAYLSAWPGLAVGNRDGGTTLPADVGEPGTSPNHALDNSGRYDFMLLSFTGNSAPINLTSIDTSWVQTDSDITVLAYKGAGTPTVDGKTVSDLTGGSPAPWQVIGSFNGGTGAGSIPIASGGVASNYWLIGGYDPAFPGAANNSLSTLDYLKIASAGGTTVKQVPEPSSLLLLSGALLMGLVTLRRARPIA